MTNTLCDFITDRIATESMPLPIARLALAIARIIDPTESNHAAHIRDAIRDNFA